MSIRKIKLIVQYDGADYHGWQIQPGQKTIQGQLTEAIQDLTGSEIIVTGASRTDAGVSPLGQTAVFEIVNCPIPTENFQKAINDRLPNDIVVTDASDAPAEFNVIGDVKSKLYRYTIYTGPTRPVLHIRHCWHVQAKLDVEAMNKAAQFLVGKHDFKSFASAKDSRESSVRTIFKCNVAPDVDWIYFEVEGDGFLYNMVRNIVGSLVEVGIGRWEIDRMQKALEARRPYRRGTNRTAAGTLLDVDQI